MSGDRDPTFVRKLETLGEESEPLVPFDEEVADHLAEIDHARGSALGANYVIHT